MAVFSKLRTQWAGSAAMAGGLAIATICGGLTAAQPVQAQTAPKPLADMCTPQAMTSVVASLGAGVIISQVPNGPRLPGGVQLVPASGKVPAFCQVTGSYVTNPKTGKTANFLATFPETWNGKYLQLGCSGTCGFLLMNDPASPPITVTTQGYPRQLIEKGYATFGNDLGHVAAGPTVMNFEWLKNADGIVNVDVLEDYLYRADFVMADMGKAMTRAFYGSQTGAPADIARSYFSGCSQGGREALVAATRFPEKFDGIIAGSPAADQPGLLWHGMGRGLFAQQAAPAKLSTGQIDMLKQKVIAQCDGLDGVKDGVIQNPAACNIHPTRDIPVCKPGTTADTCLSKPQAEAVSLWLSGVTTDKGALILPGYAISDQSYGFVAPIPAGMAMDADLRTAVGKSFDNVALATTQAGGPGGIDAFHVVANDAAYRKYADLVRRGTILPEDFSKLLSQDRKLLWYHNLSDEALTPYMSFNRYKALAKLHGGYAKLQKNIRLFSMPGTGHCGMGGNGPGNFDAAGALEAWVEKGEAPNALFARQLDPANSNLLAGKVDWSQPALRTMPLCMFPQMARYNGTGDIKDAANWSCKATDKRMLKVGVTGREAGVIR